LYWSGKDSPNAVRVDGLPILKAITDVRMCGIRNGHFNLRVSAGFRSGNKISYVEIDSEKWRIDTVDDLEACIRVLRNAFVVFHTQRDTFLASVFAGFL